MQKTLAAAAALVLALAACGKSGDSTSAGPPPPAPVAALELSQPSATMKVGDIITINVVAKDANGNALTGRTATWTSSNTSVATVSQGVVTALAPGTSTITVTVEAQTKGLLVTVQQPGVATVTLAPLNAYVQVGSTLQLTATLRDASGNLLSGRTVDWASTDLSKATVSNTGLVTGVASGLVTINATSEGKTGGAPVNITTLPPPVITSITPATLIPGAAVTITGSNFGANPTDNTVTVAGVSIPVNTASTTQLTLTIPTTMPCLPAQSAPVVVTTGGGPATKSQPLQVAPQQTLAVGQAMFFSDATSMRCNELTPGGSHYLVTLFSTSTVPSGLTAVQVGGSSALVGGLPPSPQIPAFGRRLQARPLAAPSFDRTRTAAPRIPSQLAALRALMRATAQAHARHLERETALMRTLVGARARQARFAPAQGAAALVAPVPTTVGDTQTFKVPNNGTCATFTKVLGRVVYSGTHTVILEDTTGPLKGQLASDYQSYGQLFDNTLFPIESNFGNIGADDSQLQNPGKVIMLFTPVVNGRGAGLLGFVSGCDFFDPSDASTASSNQTKIFYARAALHLTPANAQTFSFDDRPLWSLAMPATLVHETKHIVSFAERISRNASNFEESWLEEATAQIAAELYGRTVWAAKTWKGNNSYANTMYCEVRAVFAPGQFAECANYTYDVADNFFNLSDYYTAIETKSFLSPASVDATIYGSAWLFVRWMVDQYATDEGVFLRSLVQERALSGVGNIMAKTGKNVGELFGGFLLSLIADDYPGISQNGQVFANLSWNTRDMFIGIDKDFQNQVPFPLQTRTATFGPLSISVPGIAGGSAAYLDLTGTAGARQTIDLTSLPPNTPIRLAILRVQ